MALTTYNLTFAVHSPEGIAIENATILAELVTPQGRATSDYTPQGGFYPQQVSTTTDANGAATLALVPNTSGTTNSRYKIILLEPVTNKQLASEIIQMPAVHSSFYSLITANVVDKDIQSMAKTGYEFTGGFADRAVGQTGNLLGSNVQYTQEMVDSKQWYRFGFSAANQAINDIQYWGETDPAYDASKGLFGGLHLPAGVTSLFDFSDTSNQAEVTSGDLLYTAAVGSYNFKDCVKGDKAVVRFSFNVIPQIANTTIEVALIWSTRDENDNVTYVTPLTSSGPAFYGTGTQGKTFLTRPDITAYFASSEDVNARALPAIRANNEVLIQPLSTLCTILR